MFACACVSVRVNACVCVRACMFACVHAFYVRVHVRACVRVFVGVNDRESEGKREYVSVSGCWCFLLVALWSKPFADTSEHH